MKQLPNWCLTNRKPGFYDTESATTVQETAKLYKTMQELITEYTEFADEINTTITEFISTTNADQEEFKELITKILHDYIEMIDDKINILETTAINEVTEFITQAFEDGKISITTNYDEDTKNLTIVGGVN